MHPMLNTAIKAARRAGAIINRASLDLDLVKVTKKEHNDFVTEVDQTAENAIIDVLLTAYPEHRILAEESGRTGPPASTGGASAKGAKGTARSAPRSTPKSTRRKVDEAARDDALDSKAEHLWIIDPLDGTTNFIHGFPQYCVSIALAQRGQVTQAVVYDPTRNDLFTATKGRGAYLNDRRLRVTKRHRMAEALLGTGFPFRDLTTLDRYLTMFRTMTPQCAGIRRPGAAALDLAYVAAGRLDGFFEIGLSPWDIAAGSLLVTESGGLVGDFQGDPDYLFTGDVLAANPKIFAQLVGTLGALNPKRTALQ